MTITAQARKECKDSPIPYDCEAPTFWDSKDQDVAPRLIAPFFFVFLSIPASADSLTGKVVKITDGDTLYVLDANYKDHKIRLAGIDAPERRQAYGLASRKHLASIVAGNKSRLNTKSGTAMAAL